MNFHKPHVFFTYSEIDLSIYISLAPLHTITVVAVSIHRGWVLTGKSLIPGDVLLSFGSWTRSSVLTLRPTQNSWGLLWLPVPCTTMGLYSLSRVDSAVLAFVWCLYTCCRTISIIWLCIRSTAENTEKLEVIWGQTDQYYDVCAVCTRVSADKILEKLVVPI